jgi:hypothetical protein
LPATAAAHNEQVFMLTETEQNLVLEKTRELCPALP